MTFRVFLAASIVAAATGRARTVRDTYHDTWVATDALGRELPGHAECGSPRDDKTVGIFYFLWMEGGKQVYDISKLLKASPANPAYGPKHAFHWWGEPHLGYYRSDDPFVIRRHAQMLADAGVDVIVFDVTNAFTYDKTFLAICRVFEDMRRAGHATPRIAFLTHTKSEVVVKRLYDQFYSTYRHANLWFEWDLKPLIMSSSMGLDAKTKSFFTFRESWAWTRGNGWFGDGKDKWPWLDHHPQKPGWHDAPNQPEQIPVCVAQHPTSNIGRSFHDGKQPPKSAWQTGAGPCFEEQWKRALAVDPEFVFVTGWNEWIAQRFIRPDKGGPGRYLGRPLKPGETYFVDAYSQEYSRDIEPMRGGHGDNYYYQLAANIRRFKGVRPLPRPSMPKTVAMNGGFDQWEPVGPEFRDDAGDTAHRAHSGYAAKTTLRNTSGRNDFELAKVARDDAHLYFYVRTGKPIAPRQGKQWMLLLLNVDGKARGGWQGYEFLVNRTAVDDRTVTVERCTGGWRWEQVASAPMRYKGNELQLAIPRKVLGLPKSDGRLTVDFKWADNIPAEPAPVDFIDQGDVAPNGRFNYRYKE